MVGFAWGTPDLFNVLDIYDGSTLLGSFIGKTDVGPYYFDIHAGSGEAITKLVLSSNCCLRLTTTRRSPVVSPPPSLVLDFQA